MNLSFEFFPARTQTGIDNLQLVQDKLLTLGPEYFSVTFGAGGSTQDTTFATVKNIQKDGKTLAVPHISCIGSTKEQILLMLRDYKELGINRIVALRGDIPSGIRDFSDMNYAYQLVDFIKENFGSQFEIIVASYPEKHPQARSIKVDIDNLINKFNAGANKAITQYFYNLDGFLYFRDEVAKLTDKQIIPGIMPITNCKSLVRFSNMCGAEVPVWILNKLELYENDKPSLRSFGFDVVNNLCQNLKKNGVNDFHFYTMNKESPSFELAKNLL